MIKQRALTLIKKFSSNFYIQIWYPLISKIIIRVGTCSYKYYLILYIYFEYNFWGIWIYYELWLKQYLKLFWKYIFKFIWMYFHIYFDYTFYMLWAYMNLNIDCVRIRAEGLHFITFLPEKSMRADVQKG